MHFVAGAWMFSGDDGKPPGRRSAGGRVKTKMSAWWMFVIFVGCGLSHAAQPQSTCACNDRLNTVCVPVGGDVSVPCPKSDAEELKFNLLQGGEIIYNRTYSHEGAAPTCKSQSARAGVELCGNAENKTVSFVLTGVNVSSHGIYRCEGTVMFPPPLVAVPSDLRVLVLIEGHHCNIVCSDVKGGDQNCGFHWIWVIVIIGIYSIIVTISAIVIWVKSRRADSESDYMNTKPKAPRKKRGVQNPIPRHF